MGHPLFEIVQTTAGAVSIRNKVVNEIMHNPVGPWREANALYIEQSKLQERLVNRTEPLVVFDVGLGAAANALAALHCARQLSDRCPLHIVSFERDLELLHFALDHADCFEHFKGYEEAMSTLLSKHRWSDDSCTWELREGDFLNRIEEEPEAPHLVFFDPYSPHVNNEMWTTECFRRLRQKCRDGASEGTLLFTYSRATPVRAAFLAAGFYVGLGLATGLKSETTQVSTRLMDLDMPLTPRWLERWQRSHTPYPFDCKTDEDRAVLSRQVLGHAQFADASLTSR